MSRVGLLSLLLGVSCGHSVADPAEPATHTVGEPTHVYIEAAVVAVDDRDLGSLGSSDISDIAARKDGSVRSAPHLLAEIGQPSRFSILGSTPGDGHTWTFQPEILDDGRVKLAISLMTGASGPRAHTTVVLEDRQTVFVPTNAAGPGETWVLLARCQVVRDRGDLQAILEAKQQRSHPVP